MALRGPRHGRHNLQRRRLDQEDRLGQAFSAAISDQTETWAGPQNPAGPWIFRSPPSIAISGGRMAGEGHWAAYFARAGIEPLVLSCESLERALSREVARIATHVGETLDGPLNLETGLVRQRSVVNEEWRARFLAEARLRAPDLGRSGERPLGPIARFVDRLHPKRGGPGS